MSFTDKLIKSLKPENKAYRAWEKSSDRGFGIQVTPNGVKTFFLFYRFNGERRFLTLGRYPDTPLADARKMARDARTLLEQSIDPQEHRKTVAEQAALDKQRKAEEAQQIELQGSIKQLINLYVEHLRKEGKSSYNEVRRALDKNVLGVINPAMKANEIKPQHVKIILHKIIERGKLIGANRVRSYLSAAFRFGIEYDYDPKNLKSDVLFMLESNPVRDVPKPQKQEKPVDRDLSAEEVRTLWHRLDETDLSLSTIVAIKLILATGGQRVKEVLEAQWSEFNLENRQWTLPGSRTKNGKTHVVPLGNIALQLLRELQQDVGDNEYLFPKLPSNNPKPQEQPYMPLTTLSRAINRFCEQTEFEKFTPRDLRRTCKTRMGELGLSKEIRDRLHNHALDDVSSKHYDRYDYLKEKTAAMVAWDRRLQEMIA